MPRSVNGVAMELPELIESLSLIGRQYHFDDTNGVPALVLLQVAYRSSTGQGRGASHATPSRKRAGDPGVRLAGSVTLTLQAPSMVIHA